MHQPALAYRFKDFSIIFLSNAIADSTFYQPGPPSSHGAVYTYGHILKIFLAKNTEPYLRTINKVIIESDTADKESPAIEDLEARRAILSEVTFTDWIDVKSTPRLPKDSTIWMHNTPIKNPAGAKSNTFLLFDMAAFPYNTRDMIIRNKKTGKEVFKCRIRIYGEPIPPLLALVTQNNTEKNLVDSFLGYISPKSRLPEYGEILRGSSPKQAAETPDSLKKLRIEKLYETSDLVFYFIKQNENYPDSSLEYRLLNESKKESNWTKTGHRFSVTNLVRGNNYRLQVRYQAHAAWMQEYTFDVMPKWYQTTQTKIIFASVLVAAALLTGLLTYKRRLNKSRRRREQLSLEIKSIRAQLNPHFIFNALGSIQGLINKNDIPAANHYLTEFSTLLRESLHNHEKEMVPLVTEISLLQTYLKLEQLRFNFNYEINTDPAININATEIPNLILQPLVENAVKHGVSTLAEKGLIKIDFIKQEHNLLVSITDNGKKFDETKPANGYGLKLTRNRIDLLNETLKEQPVKLTIERRQETIINLLFTNWV